MPKFMVAVPWHGVKKGEVLELDLSKVNKAFHTNLVSADAATIQRTESTVDELSLDDLDEPGTEKFDWETVRQDILAELDETEMPYEPDAPAAELAAMLPAEVAEAIKLGAA